MKTLLLLFLVLFSLVSHSTFAAEGSIEIIGTGESSSPPEFATVKVTVTSLCYDQSRTAKDANAVLANELVKILETFIRTERDKVTTTGAQNIRQTEYVYLPGGTSRILCERKWRSTNSIALQTSDLKGLPDIEDKVLVAIDKSEGVDPTKVTQTYAELMQPNFHLYPERFTKLQKEAHGNAWENAKIQFDAFKEKCEFKNAQLSKIEQPSYSTYPRPVEKVYSPEATPVIPDIISVRAVWRFVWTFEPVGNCFF